MAISADDAHLLWVRAKSRAALEVAISKMIQAPDARWRALLDWLHENRENPHLSGIQELRRIVLGAHEDELYLALADLVVAQVHSDQIEE